ncbi:MAG TPA: hypothetical protein PKC67_09085 [Kiritimatiellia bacterium]|nr:hypothetical protein [Kiritimatiellia bacterium]HMP34494.1 hypothetical protein [Kiritimatiellia bacterium]
MVVFFCRTSGHRFTTGQPVCASSKSKRHAKNIRSATGDAQERIVVCMRRINTGKEKQTHPIKRLTGSSARTEKKTKHDPNPHHA